MLSFLVGCASTPLKLQKFNDRNWQGRALVRDRAQGASYIINVNFNAKRGKAVRMDVTDTLNTPVASLLNQGGDVKYVIYRSKKFFYGAAQPNVMKPILSIPFDPRWIESILFDEPIAEKSWSCTKDKAGLLSECKDSVTGLTVRWMGRSGSRKTVEITHAMAEVQINFKEFRSKVENRNNLFELEAPQGYQKLRVR